MRYKLIAVCTVFLLLLLANPAWAGVNLNINGNSYTPIVSPQLENSTTMVPLYVVGRVLGAEISIADQAITIRKGSRVLNFILNDNKADLNGEQLIMPQAPTLVNGEVLVPLRFICEALGATVSWDQSSRTARVSYSEQRQGMSVEDLLLKSSEAVLQYNTYKTKMKINLKMEMANTAKPGETIDAVINMGMDLAMQQKPLSVYGKTTIDSPTVPEGHNAAISATTEMFINEEGMFMTLPGQEGWFKMDIPGMDMKALIENFNNDPVASLRMMQDSGAIMSFGDDRQKDGQSYWVINVTLGADSFSKIFESVMGQMPGITDMGSGQNLEQELNKMMQALFKNMQSDVVYRVWVDQTSLLPKFMDLDARINLVVPATTIGNGVTGPVAMRITEKAYYEIYDLGQPFIAPDVSKAMNLNEYMEQQIPATQL
ncbi:MAG: DUF6612 family protein [Bacillota bacterium]